MPFYSIDDLVPVLTPGSYVHPTAVIIGDVIIGPECYIAPNAVLRGDFGRIVIESGSNIQDNCIMHTFPEQDCIVEAEGHIGHGAILHGCHIKRNVMVGMNAVVMDNAVIGANSIIGAMSFVKSGFSCEPDSLVIGSPARVVRALQPEEINWKREGTREYQLLARRSLNALRESQPLALPQQERPRFGSSRHRPRSAD